MKTLIFKSTPGRVTAVEVSAKGTGMPAILSASPFADYKTLIVTELTHSQDVNVQIQPSLRDSVYVTCFGDRMGQIELGGIAFPNDPTSCATPKTHLGHKALMEWYANKHPRNKMEVTLTLGEIPIRALLQRMVIRCAGQDFATGLFSISLAALPPRRA